MDLMYLLSNANFILTILIIIAASYHILYFKDILVHSGMRWFTENQGESLAVHGGDESDSADTTTFGMLNGYFKC